MDLNRLTVPLNADQNGKTSPVSSDDGKKKLRSLVLETKPKKRGALGNQHPQLSSDFEDVLLVFVPYGVEFSKKRVDIMKEQITKRGGTFVNCEFFSWDYRDGTDTYIVVNPLMPWKELLKLVPKAHHSKLNNFLYVNCEWITECLKQNRFIQPVHYLIEYDKEDKKGANIASSKSTPIKSEPLPQQPLRSPVTTKYLEKEPEDFDKLFPKDEKPREAPRKEFVFVIDEDEPPVVKENNLKADETRISVQKSEKLVPEDEKMCEEKNEDDGDELEAWKEIPKAAEIINDTFLDELANLGRDLWDYSYDADYIALMEF